jgi:hypothetical protein
MRHISKYTVRSDITVSHDYAMGQLLRLKNLFLEAVCGRFTM